MFDALLAPESIAVVGASRKPGRVGHEILANLIASHFGGEIIPVNPAAEEVLGLRCYKDIKSSGHRPALAVIAVPASSVRSSVEDAVASGAKAIVVITAGFRETGEDGARQEQELAAYCRSRGVRMLGPNCLGVMNSHHKMNASFSKSMPTMGSISVISQSGAVCTALLDLARERNIGLAKLISLGNKADITEVDLLATLAEDEHTNVIAGYLESIDAGGDFVRVAEAASHCKPVVIYKAGTTVAGSKAASSHTGSLAGADVAFGAAFRRSGVIRAPTYEALFDYAVAFAMQPPPPGDRVAIITNAGGPGIMAADAVENSGMRVVPLAESAATALKARLPAAASVANPIDVLGDADPERYVMAVEAAQNDEDVDAIIVMLTPQAMTRPAETASAVAAQVKSAASRPEAKPTPVLAVFMGGHEVLPGRRELVTAGLPDFPSPERAVAALRAMREYAVWRERPPRAVTRFRVNRRRVERIISRNLRVNRQQIGEARAKEILSAYSFNVPEGGACDSADEAVEIAERVGFPVAMKILSPDVIHKSDVGGVRLDLAKPAQVMDSYDLMILRIGRLLPQARIDGVYVERMCSPGREIILGMTRDQQFGPMLMFGLGGIFVEVLKDVAFNLAPITADEAMQMLKGTRSYAMLKGARGYAGVDLGLVAENLQRISQLATDFPAITELDINPLMVGGDGARPMVADARITLAGRGGQ